MLSRLSVVAKLLHTLRKALHFLPSRIGSSVNLVSRSSSSLSLNSLESSVGIDVIRLRLRLFRSGTNLRRLSSRGRRTEQLHQDYPTPA